MVTATSDSTTTDRNDWLDRLEQALLGVGTAASWDDLSLLAQQALDAINAPLHTLVDDDTWNNATRASADQFTRNAQYYVDKRKDDAGMTGDAWKQYLALIAAAELQLASSSVAQQAVQGSSVRIRRVTHPEATKTGPCARCKELEGEHDADSDDLWFTHPRCACTWEPVDQAAFASGAPATAGTPSGYFRDQGGKVHPIFTSPGGVRQPSANAHEWHQRVTLEQGTAVAKWSDYDSGLLKAAARGKMEQVGGHDVNNDIYEELHHFNAAIHTAPQAEGQIYRGVSGLSDERFEKLIAAKSLLTHSPTSFSTDIGRAQDFATGESRTDNTATFVARRHNAADITALANDPTEHEAVVPQGSMYHVDRVVVEPRLLPATGKRATIYISFGNLGKTKPVELAATPTPRGYFRDVSGELFPIHSDA